MNITRFFHHLCMTRWQLHRKFPKTSLATIKTAIQQAEMLHTGEVCFAIEAALSPQQLMHGITPEQRALEIFAQLRVWDTEQNNGVLIYILLADKAVEVVADRGINAKESHATWQRIIKSMQDAFAAGHFEDGAIRGVQAVAEELVRYFPASSTTLHRNELPDDVAIL